MIRLAAGFALFVSLRELAGLQENQPAPQIQLNLPIARLFILAKTLLGAVDSMHTLS